MDTPPQFNKDKEEASHNLSYEKVQADVQAAGIRGEAFELSMDIEATKFNGESDPLTPAERQKVVEYAKSLRKGLGMENSATGPEWKPYWDYCRLANTKPKKALEIAEEGLLSTR